ncbi:RNA polymerase sigma factor [Prolixibacter denitrificans]|uniref:RNA polymerase sigma-70 factor (ECF subfamily) n=1 Tax=Prolixibacter denitrificans TaxID=1541063 RepID=A0A2P8CG12_9BACT|nr:sigma-70 family RNA polymerase sigma factor [Prolixibacter denitrificans]PSK83908.1 RNA polymerase sigma-70 factor (ECF subfamily) [Prolixibacter denitrificans]GET23449.1 RNA polymerase subunit sigma-24 [Prolixibacter denitrificans]
MVEIKQLDDHALVQKFVDGEHECLEILITRHKNRIYTYIFMIVKNHAVAEDIFQDTFIKVIQSLKKGRYTENGKFVSWAIRIAHNLIIDYFRKEKHLSTVSNDESEVDIFNSPKFSDMNIEDDLVSEQIFREVRHLIDELPDDQRQVVIMRHYLGFSFREIAEHSGVSINTALGRMRYALINLRKLIEERQLNLTLS